MGRSSVPPLKLFVYFWLNVIVLLAFIFISGPSRGESWTGTLNDGSVLKVDPGSRRPMRYYDGGVAPLWNGTHRLENGSVVIVRDGQVVPTESMMNTWTGEPGSEPEMQAHFCDQLVRKACGFENECATAKPCALARQLLRLERSEQRNAPPGAGSWPQTPSGGECQAARSSSAFPPCTVLTPKTGQTPCGKLVERVCGASGECNKGKACDPARQLLQMETEERMQSADPKAVTPTGSECNKAMTNAFFEPCK